MNRQLSRVAILLGLVALLMLSPRMATTALAQDSADAIAANSVEEESVIATRNLFSVLRDGGPMLLLISMCSFVLCIFVFERSISLRRGRVIPKPFVKRFLLQLQEQQLKPEEALELCEENQSPVAQVFAAAVKKWGRPSVEVEQAVLDTGERVATGLRKYLRLFNGISTISPLLGLLGTVLGMITSFNSIASADAMGRPEMLAGGIAQALLTTAAGLTVAIPAIVAHLHFISRVDRLIIEIDDLGQQVVNAIASDGWRKPTAKKTTRKTERKQAA
ncbi:MAG: MotA/TolQ/ExbB proton channel family protein [Planctomycetaceae bacterium]|nr:MotA/TolQ/ExbB proton channel family protein [Planctomycetaceae bacterium]